MQLNQVNQHQLNQHTLNRSIDFVGRGLHSGKTTRMSIYPAAPNTGYLFVRRDVEISKAEVPARWYNVTDTHLSTTIANIQGTSVATVEHILAALYACDIDNAVLSLDGPEVPSMDGSAKPFVDLITRVGSVNQECERKVILVEEVVTVEEGSRRARLEPSPIPWISMDIDFQHPVIRKQSISQSIDKITFAKHLAAARTFGFEEQLETMRELGFARGGSLQNAILVTKSGVANEHGLRFPNEFVRHKALDAIGDLALAGGTIIGHFMGQCSGHQMNNCLLHQLMNKRSAWRYTTMTGVRKYWRERLLPLKSDKHNLSQS